MMFSLKALVPSWILIILLVNLAEGFANNITDEVEPTEDISNVTIASFIDTTDDHSTNQTVEERPTYVVKSLTGQPCLLATFNITIRVSYYVTAAKSDRKYIAFKDIVVPDIDDTYDSVCLENQTSLGFEWDNSTFNLNLTFVTHGKSEESTHTNWTLDAIALGYNLSNHIIFPGSAEDDYKTVEADDLGLYNTVIGRTKECDKPVRTTIGKGETDVVFKFEYVKIAAFNLTSETFSNETEECQVKSSSIRDEDIMVPLIIACALSFVIIVVVVAYAISRKVQEARDQSQYKPMP